MASLTFEKVEDDKPKANSCKSPLGLFSNARFRPDTSAPLYILDKAYSKCLTKFSLIFCSTEVSVYKSLHYLHDKYGLTESEIKTLDGLAIESYFDSTANHKYNIMQMDKLLSNGVLKDIASKWLVIPNMSAQWNPKLAYLFYNEVKEAGSLGIIFHSEGLNNFGEVLIDKTYLSVVQFPKPMYKGKKDIPDDEF